MKKTSPTQRTLAFLRAAGYQCAITEHWNPFAKIRQDLFGFIDVLGMHPRQQGLLGVQATTGAHHAERKAKILALPSARLWVETGNRIWVLTWTCKGARGKVKKWEPRIEEIALSEFLEADGCHSSEGASTSAGVATTE